MCSNPFKKPKVETPKVQTPPATAHVEAVKVPDPTPVQVTEVAGAAAADEVAKKKQRNRRGYAATRIAEDRSVLTDSTGSNNTLG